MATRRVPAASDVPPTDDEGGEEWRTAVTPLALAEARELAEEERSIDRLRFALAQTKADKKYLRLFRTNDKTRKLAICRNYDVDDADNIEELVREEFGPGTYELRLITSEGNGGIFQFEIAAPSRVLATTSDNGMAAVLKQIADNQAAMLQALTMQPTPKSAHEQMMETITMLSAMKNVFGAPAAAPAAPTVSPIEMMRETLGLIREAKGAAKELAEEEGEADPDNPMSMLRELMSTARAVATRQSEPAPLSLPMIQVPPSIGAQDEDDMLNLQKHVSELESMLKRNETPSAAAQYLYSVLPAGLVPMLEGDAWYAILQTASPTLAANREWCDAARAECVAIFNEAKRQGIKL